MTETLAHSESYPMNTNMTGFRCCSEILVHRTKVASALEGLRGVFGAYENVYLQVLSADHHGYSLPMSKYTFTKIMTSFIVVKAYKETIYAVIL